MKLDNSRALVVLSGGQDSTTCLFWAKKHFKEVYALSFLYGQKHAHEVSLAEAIAREAGVHFDKMDVGFIGRLDHNALTDPCLPVGRPIPSCRAATCSSWASPPSTPGNGASATW